MSVLDEVGVSMDRPPQDLTEVRDSFRVAMSRVCAPVAVVTALDGERPHGTTVSAFSSLSMEPPMILVSLDRRSDLLEIARATKEFGVNVLSVEQTDLASQFARKGQDKFAGVGWSREHGAVRIDDALAWIDCEVHELVDGGDHVVLIGLVRRAGSVAARPLTYFERTFGTHASPKF